MDVLLVLPNVFLDNRIGDNEIKEPVGLLYLTSVLRSSGYDVTILQADYYGLSVEQTVQMILLYNPSIVGFSVTQRASVSTTKIIRSLRANDFVGHISCGGYLPTLCTEDFLNYAKEVDSVVIGEGEQTFLELVQCIRSGTKWKDVKGIAYRDNEEVTINESRSLIENIDTIPFPARDLLLDTYNRAGYATLVSSRGCYGNCTFCSQNAFKKKNSGSRWRGRTPGNIVDEIEQIQANYGVKMFKFNDDNIFGPGVAGQERVTNLCKEILRRGIKVRLMAYCRINDINHDTMSLMHKAGFERLLIGVESIILSTLNRYKKGIDPEQVRSKFALLNNLGFSVIPGFMGSYAI